MSNYSSTTDSGSALLKRVLGLLPWLSRLPPDEEFGPCILTAKRLAAKLAKVSRKQLHLQKLHTQLQHELHTWSDSLADSLSQTVVQQAAILFQTQATACQLFRQYEQAIANALGVVADKERSIKQLLDSRRKLKGSLRRTATNFGEKSYNAQAIAEQLESNSANLQVSEAHYNNAINTKLKEAFHHYGLGIRSVGGNYEVVGGNYQQIVGEKVYEESLEENKHCAKCSIEHGRPMGCISDHGRDGGRKNATEIGLNVYEGW